MLTLNKTHLQHCRPSRGSPNPCTKVSILTGSQQAAPPQAHFQAGTLPDLKGAQWHQQVPGWCKEGTKLILFSTGDGAAASFNSTIIWQCTWLQTAKPWERCSSNLSVSYRCLRKFGVFLKWRNSSSILRPQNPHINPPKLHINSTKTPTPGSFSLSQIVIQTTPCIFNFPTVSSRFLIFFTLGTFLLLWTENRWK